ncbi:MAG: arylsulfotransferase family protein [Candidatus Binatia bacterium]
MRYRDVGVLFCDRERATPGFTLIVPLSEKAAYLIGLRGEVLHKWAFPLTPGNYAYLLRNGNLLWAGRTSDGPPLRSGKGGLLREVDWQGRVVWEYRDPVQHHDFRRLANGNTIYLGWDTMPPQISLQVKGGRPGTEREGVIYSDYIREITPQGETAWEWHAFSDMEVERYELCPSCRRDEFAHANACTPLDDGSVLISFRKLNLIATIDRKSRRFRWEMRDDSWGHQHDCTLLPNGNILLFANGIHTATNPHSRVIEVDPHTGQKQWEYQGSPLWTFFSASLSGAQRFPNGNTLICEGQMGRVFEVTAGGEIVWEYICPFFAPYQGAGPANSLFRAYRYGPDSPEIGGRLASPVG